MNAVPCKFPQCQQPAILEVGPDGAESFSLCAEHRRLLIDDPGEFRRLWGAIDPRPPVTIPYTMGRKAGAGPGDVTP